MRLICDASCLFFSAKSGALAENNGWTMKQVPIELYKDDTDLYVLSIPGKSKKAPPYLLQLNPSVTFRLHSKFLLSEGKGTIRFFSPKSLQIMISRPDNLEDMVQLFKTLNHFLEKNHITTHKNALLSKDRDLSSPSKSSSTSASLSYLSSTRRRPLSSTVSDSSSSSSSSSSSYSSKSVCSSLSSSTNTASNSRFRAFSSRSSTFSSSHQFFPSSSKSTKDKTKEKALWSVSPSSLRITIRDPSKNEVEERRIKWEEQFVRKKRERAANILLKPLDFEKSDAFDLEKNKNGKENDLFASQSSKSPSSSPVKKKTSLSTKSISHSLSSSSSPSSSLACDSPSSVRSKSLSTGVNEIKHNIKFIDDESQEEESGGKRISHRSSRPRCFDREENEENEQAFDDDDEKEREEMSSFIASDAEVAHELQLAQVDDFSDESEGVSASQEIDNLLSQPATREKTSSKLSSEKDQTESFFDLLERL